MFSEPGFSVDLEEHVEHHGRERELPVNAKQLIEEEGYRRPRGAGDPHRVPYVRPRVVEEAAAGEDMDELTVGLEIGSKVGLGGGNLEEAEGGARVEAEAAEDGGEELVGEVEGELLHGVEAL